MPEKEEVQFLFVKTFFSNFEAELKQFPNISDQLAIIAAYNLGVKITTTKCSAITLTLQTLQTML